MNESLNKKDGALLGAVVIILDTLRADHVSCYGHNRKTTPVIDSLAKKSVVFEQVISSSPWTLPSIGCLLSGQGIFNTMDKKGMLRKSIIEDLSKAGLSTAAITEGCFFSKLFQMDRGFEYYYEEEGANKLFAEGELVVSDCQANSNGNIANTFKKASEWLDGNKDKPFFLLIHTYEPHAPYTNHYFTDGMDRGKIGEAFKVEYLKEIKNGTLTIDESEKEYIHALYEGGIHLSDSYVGELLTFLKKIGLDDKTLIAVTSDHGEELGDHHESHIFNHGHSLKDDLLKVPLIIHDPTRKFPVDRVDAQVRLFDLLPTIADLLGIEISYPTAGRSLTDFMTKKETSDRLVLSGHTTRGPNRISIRNGRYKYIETIAPARDAMLTEIPKYQLYDLLVDPGEKVNLASSQIEAVRTMTNFVHTKLNLNKQVVDIRPVSPDEQVRQRLESLGYL